MIELGGAIEVGLQYGTQFVGRDRAWTKMRSEGCRVFKRAQYTTG
jgi:hypothetical protein